MPSRVRLELGLRAAAFALLGFGAWALATGARGHGGTAARDDDIRGSLADWSRQAPADTIALALRTAPAAVERAWLAALAGAGTVVTWSGSLPATALAVTPIADPAGGSSVLAAAPPGAWVHLADSLGGLDSARVSRGGAAFRIAAHTGPLAARALAQRAAARPVDSLVLRHLVVLGRAGWEARFVVTALEERGWTVDARLAVAPGIAVTQGRPSPLDTARHAAVVALDSLTPGDAAAIARFLASGGGAVLAAPAARSAPGIGAGTVGAHVRAPALSFAAASGPRRALAIDPVLPRADAVVLDRERGHTIMAARRIGAGRVVQIGFDETWRWRMGGGAGAPLEHREWWSAAVAAAAYKPTVRREARGESGPEAVGDRAPLASLVAQLGPAHPAGERRPALPDPRRLLPAAAGLLLLSLLGEWASRRLRGAA